MHVCKPITACFRHAAHLVVGQAGAFIGARVPELSHTELGPGRLQILLHKVPAVALTEVEPQAVVSNVLPEPLPVQGQNVRKKEKL